MRRSCLLFCLVFFLGPLHAEIYKWADSDGNVHFSDKPHPGAQEVVLPKVQTYSSPQPPLKGSSPSKEISDEAPAYETFSIVQPENQATIRNPQGYLSVIVELKPTLRKGDRLQMVFDGNPIDKPRPTTVFALQDINRGSHTLAAQLSDAKGNILGTSDAITIYMMPPRVGMGTNNH